MARIRLIIATALCAILMACGPKVRPEPATKVITTEVKVPVPVACVNARDVPAEPAKVGVRLNGQAAHDLDIVSGSAIVLRQWGRELSALIRPCVKP